MVEPADHREPSDHRCGLNAGPAGCRSAAACRSARCRTRRSTPARGVAHRIVVAAASAPAGSSIASFRRVAQVGAAGSAVASARPIRLICGGATSPPRRSTTRVATTLPSMPTRRRCCSAVAADRQQALAVAGEAADRHLVDDRGAAAVEPHHVAVLDDERLRHLAVAARARHARSGGAPRHAPGSAICGRTIWYMRTSSSRAGWPETWTKWSSLGHDLDAEPHQRVLQPADRLLVAGDDARGEDHGVAVLEHDVRVVVAGDAGQRGARLALAAGADQQRPCRAGCSRPRPRSESAASRRDSRSRAPPCPCATASGRPAPTSRSWARAACGDRRQPRHVRGEAGDRDPPVIAADQLGQGLAAARLRSPNAPSAQRVGRSRRPSPARPRRRCARSAASSVSSPISGSGSSFQSPVCNTVPSRGADRHRVRLGDRMRQGDQLEIERADREPARHRHGR